MRVGVVGAGISGLLCAQRLGELLGPGVRVSVLEWGRGPGGRTARRRVTLGDGSCGEVSFDHAAPLFAATTDEFRSLLEQWRVAGVAAPWPEAGESVWVGTPSNNAIARHLVKGVEAAGGSIHFGQHVLAAEHNGGVWNVRAEERASGMIADFTFDALVLSDKLLVLPNTYAVLAPPQIGKLALPPGLASAGTIVLLIALEGGDGFSVPSSGGAAAVAAAPVVQFEQHPIFARVVHESSKPGRPQQEQDALAANQEPARTLLPSVDKRHHRRQDAVQQRHPVPAGQG